MLWQQIAPCMETTSKADGYNWAQSPNYIKIINWGRIECYSAISMRSENMPGKIPADKSGSTVELNNI